MKTGRNNPCPCGSGKKYKKCCMDSKIIPFPGISSTKQTQNRNVPSDMEEMMFRSMGFNSADEMDLAMADYKEFCEAADAAGNPIPSFREFMGQGNMASDLLSQMKSEIGDRVFQSEEELNAFATEFMDRENEAPVEDFLDLSSRQVGELLKETSLEYCEIFSIHEKLNDRDVEETQAVRYGQYFLYLLAREEGSVPLTAKGNLKQAHCTELVEYILSMDSDSMRPVSEDRFPLLTTLRYTLDFAGYTETLKTKIKLTAKGYDYLLYKNPGKLFLDLMKAYVNQYDWVSDFIFNDRCSFVQESLPFSLYLLHKKGSEFKSEKEYYQYFEKAFPLIRDIPVLPNGINIMPQVYSVMFFDNFCSYFGLVERKPEDSDGDTFLYKTSRLFKKLFVWKV